MRQEPAGLAEYGLSFELLSRAGYLSELAHVAVYSGVDRTVQRRCGCKHVWMPWMVEIIRDRPVRISHCHYGLWTEGFI
jgi:hypothetical protein